MLVRKAQKGRHMRVAALLSVLSQVERFSPLGAAVGRVGLEPTADGL